MKNYEKGWAEQANKILKVGTNKTKLGCSQIVPKQKTKLQTSSRGVGRARNELCFSMICY